MGAFQSMMPVERPPQGQPRPLCVQSLHIAHRVLGRIVEDVSLEVHAGEAVALVGESGSGKSLTALALMRLLPPGFAISQGRISVNGERLLAKTEREMNALRGRRVAMLFQQPQVMLDPTATIGAQIAEPLRLHLGLGRRAASERVHELLREVGIPEPELRSRGYAHQLSGGMAQRVMIACALSGDPQVLIADEPTTALDVTVQAQILQLLNRARHRRGLAVLLITHDLGVVSAFADRVAVMYAGRLVETGTTREILDNPQHPYTQALVTCSLMRAGRDGKLSSIPGSAPQPTQMRRGCRFHPRCQIARRENLLELCEAREPELRPAERAAAARCWALANGEPERPRG